MRKNVLFLFLLLTVSGTVFSDTFSKYVTPAEKKSLENGEILIKKHSSYKKLSLSRTTATEKTLDLIKKLDPSYITEIIQIKPYKGNEKLIEKVDAALMDIEDYTGIPYYSERHEKWYELYSSAKVTQKKTNGNKTFILADLEMSVFGIVKTQIEVEKNEDSYFYCSKNLNTLRYHDRFDAVDPQAFKSSITVFRDGDNWILYGTGGIDVPRIPFISGRIETSFLNRTKSFCNFIFGKLK